MVYTRPKTVTHPGTNRARRALTSFMRRTPLTTTPRRQPPMRCGHRLTQGSFSPHESVPTNRLVIGLPVFARRTGALAGGRQRKYPPQYYYVLPDIADQYWLPSVRSASSRFHSAIRRHQFASVRQADSRLTRLIPPTLNSH